MSSALGQFFAFLVQLKKLVAHPVGTEALGKLIRCYGTFFSPFEKPEGCIFDSRLSDWLSGAISGRWHSAELRTRGGSRGMLVGLVRP